MNGKIEQFSRIIHHRLTASGAMFTNPQSNDHTDSTWKETDLYIGELGINVTDNKVFFRSNNGIFQLGTTSSTADTLWVLTEDGIAIAGTSSPAILRNTDTYSDLGNTTLRFKDLYLGGGDIPTTTIDVNEGFTIEGTDVYISSVQSNYGVGILLSPTSSNTDVDVPVIIASPGSSITGNNNTIIGSSYSTIINGLNCNIIGGNGVVISTASNVTHIGNSYGRDTEYNEAVVIGGTQYIRGVESDLTTTYDKSDLAKGQSKLTTQDGLANEIFTLPWFEGEVIQFNAKILGIDVLDNTNCYSSTIEIMAYHNGTPNVVTPIIHEMNNFVEVITVGATADTSTVSITVTGNSNYTIKWLCSYEYHILKN